MKLEYTPPGPVAEQYLVDDSFVTGIRGPIGSGKSTASVMKLTRNAYRQKQSPDGIKRRRTAIIRNTYPELKTTTIKTWHQWWPETVGSWVSQGPPTHRIRQGGLDWEVLFIALDNPRDVAKLLSLELSDAWINEAREVPKAVLDGLTGRIGRYPAVRDGGCTTPQIIMDTNPPDSDHWWHKFAEDATPEGWSFYAQPGGRTPQAENAEHLPPRYYERAIPGKTEEWIKVYVDGEYGYITDGKPVWPEYRDGLHCKEFTLERGPLWVGMDFGLTPAATIGRRMPNGRWVVDREIVTERMGAIPFAEELKRVLTQYYPNWPVEAMTGDPAGNQGQAGDKDARTIFELLSANGVKADAAYTNDFTPRREAVSRLLSSIVDGSPGLILHPRCKVLRKACAGKYQFARIQVSGDERFHEKPYKNDHSHVAEALQYMLMGTGEGREIVHGKDKPMTAINYDLRGIV